MDKTTVELSADAEQLRALHRPGTPLILVNVWDFETARSVVAAGGRAIATSSAAVNAVMGAADDNTASSPLFDAVRSISAGVMVPVTADVEGGYGLPADELISALIGAGAVGCNVEDSDYITGIGLVEVHRHSCYLRELRAAAEESGVPIVINARIDTILRSPGRELDAVFDETVERARSYFDAGVDCIYPIGLGDPGGLSRLVHAVPGNINVNPKSPINELADAGAARISFGAAPYRWMMVELERRARSALGGDASAFV
jgi:2-methylisocitrate lyase-like PEP mutase family enzyme